MVRSGSRVSEKKTQCLDPINSEYTNLDPKSSTVILVGRIRILIWTSLLPDPDPMILKGQILMWYFLQISDMDPVNLNQDPRQCRFLP